jgi:flavin reductase (DIM6/NTAB) family NADH-FMN oxidoreductase RutF
MMFTLDHVLAACRSVVFGSPNLHQQCPVGLRDPQSEVCVWLHGFGAPRDVTHGHVMAAARPLTVGIGSLNTIDSERIRQCQPSLEFREQSGENKLLGRIDLRWKETIPLATEQLCLFETIGCRNYCLPKAQLWARYAHHAYQNWRASRRYGSASVPIPRQQQHSLFVFYICPRPVALVTVVEGDLVNIFPMDLIGPIGSQHFSLALHDTSTAIPSLERSRRIALSSVPANQISVAYELGPNHRKPCVELDRIPFATSPSTVFGLPVPRFALRVREMLVEAVRDMGSHKLFLARMVGDEHWSDGPQLFFVHGIYHARRDRNGGDFGEWDTNSCLHRGS